MVLVQCLDRQMIIYYMILLTFDINIGRIKTLNYLYAFTVFYGGAHCTEQKFKE